MNNNITQNTNYNLIKEDSELQLALIDKYVKIQIIKNCCHTGFVHSVDPVTHSIILLIPQGDTYKTTIIPGHAILDVTEEVLPADIKPPQRKQLEADSGEDLLKRKKKLIAWFKLNLLPVSEQDDAIIIGNVNLLPPYKSLDLCTDNPIVAMQIKKILERMPEDMVTV
ncbi:unnamed protein product [Arctia plantaginis]|uniref:AD domain-containing protein n=1 Tax=Arctia plantaginis TaxID=874455 RepID=A0A8S1AXW1_ARCPL|nr:unnamed protein product [Arctia plantaginis]